jgi:hypothetical protein
MQLQQQVLQLLQIVEEQKHIHLQVRVVLLGKLCTKKELKYVKNVNIMNLGLLDVNLVDVLCFLKQELILQVVQKENGKEK